MDSAQSELIELTRKLLHSIAHGDWETYAALCDPNLTAFEPEARGQLVEGMAFHKFYFDISSNRTPRHTTIVAPHVWLMGDSAVVSYVRLTQRIDDGGSPTTARFEETRVWQKQGGAWKHVHFHRSANE